MSGEKEFKRRKGEAKPQTETQRAIRRLEALLPKAKAKVMAVLWMTVISAVLLVGSTYAWVTLSTNPEVSGVETTLTANGSLEIALSDLDGLEPDTSAVGDSSAAQEVTKANLTWGNLVNLSDASYGLSEITLRPSVLNLYSLLTNPLQAVSYGTDGRITAYTDSFVYTAYDPDTEQKFVIPEVDSGNGSENSTFYGVRAISYVNYESADANEKFAALKSAAYSQLAMADQDYNSLVNNEEYISALAGVMGPYVSQYAASFLGTSTGDGDCSEYIEEVYQMAAELQTAYEELGEAYVKIAQLQQAKESTDSSYDDWTVDSLLAADEATLTAAGISITDLAGYGEDRTKLAAYVDELYGYYAAYRDNGTKVYYSDLSEILDFVADVSTATVNGMTIDDSQLMGYVIKNYNNLAVSINGGCLYRIEERIQSALMATDVELPVTAGSYSLTPKVDVSTSAEGVTAWDDYSDAIYGAMFAGTDATARETYAFAVDLWVHTNAEGESYLTLEGDVVTENGEVVGYVGDDRVWDDYNLTTNGEASIQGMGSCFVFSTDDALTTLQTQELLEAMTIAFVDENGSVLAYADMDTENIWEDSGRCVVPITVRNSGSNYILQTDDDGYDEMVCYITKLTQNEAQRITAIVYLDGTQLTNEQASAANDIVGQLNLQFGTTASLEAVVNEELASKSVSATVTVDQSELSYTGEAQTVTVTAVVSADEEPTSVTGYFLRQVSSAQGEREETLTFTKTGTDANGNGIWTASTTFTLPGTYVLTALTLDGREYTISQLSGGDSERVTVTMSEYSVSSVYGEYASGANIFEVENSTTADVSVTLYSTVLDALDDVETVQGVFLSEDGTRASADMSLVSSDRSSGTWTGTFRFSSSGTYTLAYVYINGEAYGLSDDIAYTLNVTLGLTARIWISTEDELEEGETATYFMLPEDGFVTLDVYVALTDDAGNALTAEDIGSETLVIKYTSDTIIDLDADLTYDSGTGRYMGQFQVYGGGVYTLASLTATGTAVTNISNAPTITALAYSEAVTEYYADSSAESQVILTSKAYLSVDLTNATDLSVTATVEDEDTGETYEGITGTLTDSYISADGQTVSAYSFELPTDEDGATQDGYWSLTSLTLTDFIDAGGTEYSSANGESCTWDMAEVTTEEVRTKVVSTIYVDLAYGGTETSFSGEFMTDHIVEGSTMTLTDYEGDPIPERYVTDTKLVYGRNTQDSTSLSVSTYPAEFDMELPWVYNYYGGTELQFYSGSQTTVRPAMVVSGEYSDDGMWSFTLNFRVSSGTYGKADRYEPGAMFTVDGRTFGVTYYGLSSTNYPNGLFWEMTDDIGSSTTSVEVQDQNAGPVVVQSNTLEQVTVAWDDMTVDVDSLSPDANTLFRIGYSDDEELDNLLLTHNYMSSTSTKTTAYVMDEVGKDSDDNLTYTPSKVTLKLTGGGDFDKAVLSTATDAKDITEVVFTDNSTSKTTMNVQCTNTSGSTTFMSTNTIAMYCDQLVCTIKLSTTIAVTYYAPVTTTYATNIVVNGYYKVNTTYMASDYQNESDDFYDALAAALPTERITKASATGVDLSMLTIGSGTSSSSPKTGYITYTFPENVTFEVDGVTYKVTQWKYRQASAAHTALSTSTTTATAGTSKTITRSFVIYPYNFEVVVSE